MKILFIQSNGLSEAIGLCNLSSFLKKHNHHADLILLSHAKDIYRDIKICNPDILGFTAFTGMHQEVFDKASKLKKMTGLPVIVGGPHATFYSECILEYPQIDYVCSGEGEYPLLTLLERMKKNENVFDIPGISARDQEGNIYRNGLASNVEDIEQMPAPDRDLYFKKYNFLASMPMKRFLSGYGCPYDCTFCNEPWLRKELKISNSKFMRKKSATKMLDEIEEMRSKYPLKRVHFSDDLFAVDIKWLAEFSEKYRKDFNISFSCNLRFDSLRKKTVELLKNANCYAVQVGIESGSEYLRNVILKKNISDKEIIDGAALLKKYGIKLYTTNIIGLPGETIEDAFSTIKINHKAKADFVRVNTLMPFPNTEITALAIKEGLIDKDFSVKNFTTDDPLHLFCKTDYTNEFKNIASLFFYMVKFPRLFPLFKRVIKTRNNTFIRLFGVINIIQDTAYFNISVLRGFIFFFNAVLLSNSENNLHWVPFKISFFQKFFLKLKQKKVLTKC